MTNSDLPEEDNLFLNGIQHVRKLEKQIAAKLGLPDLKSGRQIIRNDKGWRENEKEIEYVWIVIVARSFVGWGGLFSVRFNENKFRDYANPNELVQGIFTYGNDGIEEFFSESKNDTTDNIAENFQINLFESNNGNAYGIEYKVRIMARDIDSFIRLNNANTNEWKAWEEKIFTMGSELAKSAGEKGVIELFTR